MANVFVDDSHLSAIGEAIRIQKNTEDKFKPSEMAEAILSIVTPGDEPAEVFVDIEWAPTYNINTGIANKNTGILLDAMNSVKPTKMIMVSPEGLDAESLGGNAFKDFFANFTKDRVPLLKNLELSEEVLNTLQSYEGGFPVDLYSCFSECSVEELPDWFQYLKPVSVRYLFSNYSGDINTSDSERIDVFPEIDFSSVGDCNYYLKGLQQGREIFFGFGNVFFNCANPRTIPQSMLRQLKFKNATKEMFDTTADQYISKSCSPYYYTFYGCNRVGALNNVGVSPVLAPNPQYIVNGCDSLYSFTFETNSDGTPIVADWYEAGTWNFTYNALGGMNWDHDSMVETINSLPDVSANSGGATQTINFTGLKSNGIEYGGNELTEAEIAVATARGWTVGIKTY